MAHTGTMIALHFDEATARVVAIEGGEAADDLHATLAYLSADDNPELTRDAVEAAVAPVLKDSPLQVLTGSLGGLGRFSASDTSDGKDVVYAALDAPGLAELRTDIVRALAAAGLKVASDHDFTPHVTLSYVGVDDDTPMKRLAPVDVEFNGVHVTSAEERGELLPFSTRSSERGAPIRMRGRGTRITRRSIRAAQECDLNKRTIEGWFSVYNDPQEHDTYGTIFEAGAYDRSVELHNEGKYRVKVFDRHGRAVGKVIHIEERSADGVSGLWGRVHIEDTPEGNLVLKKICEGTYDGFSVSFVNGRERTLRDVSKRTGKRVKSIYYAELVEISILGDRSDINARITSVRSAAGGHMKDTGCACGVRGAALASLLGDRLTVLEEGGASREDVIAEVASAAGIDVEEVVAIFAGEVDAPDAGTIEAIASTTGLTADELNEAAAVDSGQGDERSSDDVDAPAADAGEKTRASSRAAEEMLDAIDTIAAQLQRLRELLAMSSDEQTVEIVDEQTAAAERSARVKRASQRAAGGGGRAEVTDDDKVDLMSLALDRLNAALTPPTN